MPSVDRPQIAMSRAVSSVELMIILLLVQGRYHRVHMGTSCHLKHDGSHMAP